MERCNFQTNHELNIIPINGHAQVLIHICIHIHKYELLNLNHFLTIQLS